MATRAIFDFSILFPAILIGLLAIFDTFLIYKIAEYRYNRRTAFIASTLFAVMPLTTYLRLILLEPITISILLGLRINPDLHHGKTSKFKPTEYHEDYYLNSNFGNIITGIQLFLQRFPFLP